jgi:hypothetical protein
MKDNIYHLQTILKEYKKLNEYNGFQTSKMRELYQYFKK